MKRTALVSGLGTAEGVARYLPSHWKVTVAAEGNGRVLAMIEGHDGDEASGWTFHDYVQPRLASGNYGVWEGDADLIYVAVSGARGLQPR